jgi:hypothetical protein
MQRAAIFMNQCASHLCEELPRPDFCHVAAGMQMRVLIHGLQGAIAIAAAMAWMVLRRSASRIDMVIVAAGVAIAVPRIQKLDRGNNATFLFGQNATLPISRYRLVLYNVCYVKYIVGRFDRLD